MVFLGGIVIYCNASRLHWQILSTVRCLFSYLFGPRKRDDRYNIKYLQYLWMVILRLFEDGKSLSSTPLVICELHWPLLTDKNDYRYIWSPPPWSTYKHFIWELPVFYAHFFLPEKWHSHVSISFTYYVSCRPRHTHTCNFVFVYFFVISWGFGQKPKKHWENQKKQNCKTHVGTSSWVRVCNFGFFVFFGFLEVFSTLGQKPKKHWENQKKQKKTKLQDPCRYKLVS